MDQPMSFTEVTQLAQLTLRFERELAQYKLTPLRLLVLQTFVINGPMHATAAAEILGINARNTSHVTRDLTSSGYLFTGKPVLGKNGLRIVPLIATPKAFELIETLGQLNLARLSRPLGDEEEILTGRQDDGD